MNFLKKGPELKLSEIKVPTFVQDVYYDLKERHLLPLAIVLIVAIVAVPIALSQSSDSGEASTAPGPATASATTATGGQLVAESAPGLRDFRRRLRGLSPKNPFRQQFTGESEGGAGAGETSTGAGATETGTTGSSEVPSSGGTTGTTGTGTEETTVHRTLTYYSYAIDIRVSTQGESGQSQHSGPGPTPKAPETSPPRQWTTRHNLPELTMLPSRQTPAVIYMGSTKDGEKALMLISSDVTSIFGDATCVLGSKTCELLAMEPGVPETFVYGPAGRTFKIELLKIHLVESKKLNRAPLGEPKKKHGEGS
jgi:hypothetical protein